MSEKTLPGFKGWHFSFITNTTYKLNWGSNILIQQNFWLFVVSKSVRCSNGLKGTVQSFMRHNLKKHALLQYGQINRRWIRIIKFSMNMSSTWFHVWFEKFNMLNKVWLFLSRCYLFETGVLKKIISNLQIRVRVRVQDWVQVWLSNFKSVQSLEVSLLPVVCQQRRRP